MAEICMDTKYLAKRHGDVSPSFLRESTNERLLLDVPARARPVCSGLPEGRATHPLVIGLTAIRYAVHR